MSKEVLEDNIEDFENQSWCQMDKEKYDLSDFDKEFPHQIAEVIDDFGSTTKKDIKQYIQTKIDQEVKKRDEEWIQALEKANKLKLRLEATLGNKKDWLGEYQKWLDKNNIPSTKDGFPSLNAYDDINIDRFVYRNTNF